MAEMTLRGQRSDPFKLIFGSSAELLISYDDPPGWVCGKVWFQLNGHFALKTSFICQNRLRHVSSHSFLQKLDPAQSD